MERRSRKLETGNLALSFFQRTKFNQLFLLNNLPTRPVTGCTATLANQGVPHKLTKILSGNNAFVTAYAVAASTKIRIPPCPRFHHLSLLVISIFPTTTSPSRAPLSRPKPNQPFFLKSRPSFSMPSCAHFPSAKQGGSRFV